MRVLPWTFPQDGPPSTTRRCPDELTRRRGDAEKEWRDGNGNRERGPAGPGSMDPVQPIPCLVLRIPARLPVESSTNGAPSTIRRCPDELTRRRGEGGETGMGIGNGVRWGPDRWIPSSPSLVLSSGFLRDFPWSFPQAERLGPSADARMSSRGDAEKEWRDGNVIWKGARIRHDHEPSARNPAEDSGRSRTLSSLFRRTTAC